MSDTSDNTTKLIEALDSPDKPTIRAAVDDLIPFVQHSADLCETLEQLLQDEQRANRWAVAYVLAHLPQPSLKTCSMGWITATPTYAGPSACCSFAWQERKKKSSNRFQNFVRPEALPKNEWLFIVFGT